MRTIRNVHLYLGCIFAPLLIFYAITGAWQCFDLHSNYKDGTNFAPPLVREMSRVHMNAKVVLYPSGRAPGYFRYYVLVMSIGLVSTSLLGVVMALKVIRRKWLVWACLGMGVLFPWWLNYGSFP
jgi:hypothetical protein